MTSTTQDLLKLINDQNARLYGAVNTLRTKKGLPANAGVSSDVISKMFATPINYKDFQYKGSTGSKKSGSTLATTPLSQVEKAQKDLSTSELKAAGIKLPNKGNWFSQHVIDPIVGTAQDTGKLALKGLAEGLDMASRPMTAVESALYAGGASEGLHQNYLKALASGFAGGLTGKDSMTHTGADLIRQQATHGMKGGWLKSAIEGVGGFGIDVLADPTTYITLGATSLGKEAGLKAAEEIAAQSGRAIEPGVKKALQQSAEDVVARGIKKKTTSEIETELARMVQERAGLKTVQDAAVKSLDKELAAQGLDRGVSNYAQRLSDTVSQHLSNFEQQARAGLESANTRRVAVKLVGRDVLSHAPSIGEKLYKPYQILDKSLFATRPFQAAKQAFQIGSHFPGEANRLRRIAEGRGVAHFERETKRIAQDLKGVTPEEERTLLRDLEHGIRTTGVNKNGVDLGQVYDKFAARRDEQFQHLVDAGIYTPAEKAPGYVPHFYQSGTPEAISKFKADRKTALRAVGTPFGNDIAAAKAAGLKPLDRIGDAFAMGEANVSRKVGRAFYNSNAIDNFGVKAAKGFEKMLSDRGMVDVTKHMHPAQQMLLKNAGESMWMHPEIARTMETFQKFAKLGSNRELNDFVRLMGRGTDIWKRSATIFNPGNWVNNTAGDMMMNYMDGVWNPKWYKRAGSLLHDVPNGTIELAGSKYDKSFLKDLYERTSAGGFIHPDLSGAGLKNLGPLQDARKAIERGYQHREDFSRMAHWLQATEDELSRLPRTKGLKLQKARIEEAAKRAGDRVAKWNIDYSALTPTERQIKKFIPFYTWQRKAVPLMLEALITKPGRVATINKAETAIDKMLGGPSDQPGTNYPVAIPMWLRDAGYMRVTGGKNPWTIRNPLPTNVMPQVFGGGTSGILMNQIAGLHPLARMAIEHAFQKTAFTGQPTPGGYEYALQQLPFMNTLAAITGTDYRGNQHLNAGQRIATLLGSKPYQITDNRQASELRRQAQPYKTQVAQIDAKLKDKGISMTTNKDGSVTVYKPKTATSPRQILGRYGGPTDAMTAAIKFAGLG